MKIVNGILIFLSIAATPLPPSPPNAAAVKPATNAPVVMKFSEVLAKAVIIRPPATTNCTVAVNVELTAPFVGFNFFCGNFDPSGYVGTVNGQPVVYQNTADANWGTLTCSNLPTSRPSFIRVGYYQNIAPVATSRVFTNDSGTFTNSTTVSNLIYGLSSEVIFVPWSQTNLYGYIRGSNFNVCVWGNSNLEYTFWQSTNLLGASNQFDMVDGTNGPIVESLPMGHATFVGCSVESFGD